jgi:uncharacterized Zn finger protein
MTKIIHCDKCNSDNVLHEPVRQPVQEEHVTMTDIVKGSKDSQWQHAVYTYTYYMLLCKDCGHRVEYFI